MQRMILAALVAVFAPVAVSEEATKPAAPAPTPAAPVAPAPAPAAPAPAPQTATPAPATPAGDAAAPVRKPGYQQIDREKLHKAIREGARIDGPNLPSRTINNVQMERAKMQKTPAVVNAPTREQIERAIKAAEAGKQVGAKVNADGSVAPAGGETIPASPTAPAALAAPPAAPAPKPETAKP